MLIPGAEKKIQIEKDVEAFGEVLSQESEIMDEALSLGLRQRNCLVKNDLQGLQEISLAQDKLSQKLEASEERRVEVFAAILQAGKRQRVDPKAFDSLKCEEVFPYMEENSREWIASIRDSLKEKMEKLRHLNEVNATLIMNSRRITRHTIELLTGGGDPPQQAKSRTYGAEGKMQQYKKTGRNLVNHKV